MTYDFTRRMSGFQMANPVVVYERNGEPVVAYVSEYQGRVSAHIRTLYKGRNDEWCPGKGVSFPREDMTDILLKLAERFVVEPTCSNTATFEPKPVPNYTDRGGLVSPQVRTEADVDREARKGTPTRVFKQEVEHHAFPGRGVQTMPKMSNGLEGLARLKSSMGGTNGNGKPEPTDAQWSVFLSLTAQLSPENLSCDGELSRSQTDKKRRQLMAAWAAAEKGVGRKVSEDEVWAWERRTSSARALKAVPAARKTEKRRSR